MLLKKLIAWEKQYGHRTVVEFLMNGLGRRLMNGLGRRLMNGLGRRLMHGLGRRLMNGLGRRLINYILNAQCVRQLPFAS